MPLGSASTAACSRSSSARAGSRTSPSPSACTCRPSPCLRRLKALEHDGVIDGYRAVLDREAVGLGLTAFVELKVEGHSDRLADAIQEAVAKMPEVVACHIVSGAADFLLEVVVPDLRAYERFLLGSLLKLPSVADVRSNFAIRTVKAPGPLPLGHLA